MLATSVPPLLRGQAATACAGAARAIKVLQVIHAMDRAGAETLILNAVRRLHPTLCEFDFLVRLERRGDFDSELEALGCRIYRRKGRFGLPLYIWTLFRLCRQRRYDAIHSHMHYLDGIVLLTSALAGVRRRISHSHNTSDGRTGVGWDIYHRAMRRLICAAVTHPVGVSEESYRALFGGPPLPGEIVRNGIDLKPYEQSLSRPPRRGNDSLVLVHIGRFHPQKNHRLVVQCASIAAREVRDLTLLLVGTGPLRATVEQRTIEEGIAGRTKFLGVRADVPEILASADVLVFPSLFEGLGMAIVEAQAAGIPSVVSDTIPRSVDLGLGLVRFVPLNAGPDRWAAECIDFAKTAPRLAKDCRLKAIREKGYDADQSAQEWFRMYDRGAGTSQSGKHR